MAICKLKGNYLNVWGNPINEKEFTISLQVTPTIMKDMCICGLQRGDNVTSRSPSMFLCANGDLIYDSYAKDGARFNGRIENVFKVNETALITWTKSEDEYNIYKDGSLIHTAEAPKEVKTNSNYYFGNASGTSFEGSIGNVQVYVKALNVDDIELLKHTRVSDKDAIKLFWDFEGEKPFFDKSENGFNAHYVHSCPTILDTSNSTITHIDLILEESINSNGSVVYNLEFFDADGKKLPFKQETKTAYRERGTTWGFTNLVDGKDGTATFYYHRENKVRFVFDEPVLIDKAFITIGCKNQTCYYGGRVSKLTTIKDSNENILFQKSGYDDNLQNETKTYRFV